MPGPSQTSEQQAVEALDKLKKLSQYTMQVLRSESIQPGTLYPRKAYLHGLLIYCESFTDGVIELMTNGQARAASPLIRGIYECWVNCRFVYASRERIWTYHVVAEGEVERLRRLDSLLAKGHVSATDFRKNVRDAKKVVNLAKRRYPAMPVVPGVIAAGNTRFITVSSAGKYDIRPISLLQKCKIVDHYRPVSHGSISMEDHYKIVYAHFSDVSHVSPRELNSLFQRTPAGWNIDISGGQDRVFVARLLHTAFLFHYDLLTSFLRLVATSHHTIPIGLQNYSKSVVKEQ
jgi:hypothetical protein